MLIIVPSPTGRGNGTGKGKATGGRNEIVASWPNGITNANTSEKRSRSRRDKKSGGRRGLSKKKGKVSAPRRIKGDPERN